MQTEGFDFELPPELIAQAPAPQRDLSRLLVLHRGSGQIAHRRFRDLPEYLRAGDILVLNDSRVIPARLRGINGRTGGQFEILLLEETSTNNWWAMLRPSKRARVGTQIVFLDAERHPSQVRAKVVETNAEGHRRLHFAGVPDVARMLDALGEVPLPPYIDRKGASHRDHREEDRERYQTVFAKPTGSVAAPTAGLHFTQSLLDEIRSRDVLVCFVTLHVGLGTFAPVKAETIAAHTMHEERYELSEETAHNINKAKREGRRVIAVGTTSLRVMESVAEACSKRWKEASCPAPAADQSLPGSAPTGAESPLVVAGAGKTRIFIYPPCGFKVADALLTNFHLPRSTLLMLASAFAAPNETRGRELILAAYAEAVRERYRFFSYGDAMLIL